MIKIIYALKWPIKDDVQLLMSYIQDATDFIHDVDKAEHTSCLVGLDLSRIQYETLNISRPYHNCPYTYLDMLRKMENYILYIDDVPHSEYI